MSKFKKLHGNYLGIVVQNNDPQRRGRVKIYVPQISPTSYVGWINSVNDKKYKFIGKNINSSLNDIIEDLKKILVEDLNKVFRKNFLKIFRRK